MSLFPPHELSCALKPFYESFGVGPAILDIQSAARCKLLNPLWSKADCARLAFQSAMIPSLSYGKGNKNWKRRTLINEAVGQAAAESIRGILERSTAREKQAHADRKAEERAEGRLWRRTA